MLETYFCNRKIPLLHFPGDAVTPLRFSGASTEHLATRSTAGLFDFSFMGCFRVRGSDSLRYLHRIQTRNLYLLPRDRIAYTLLCRPDGSVFIDATVWNHGDGIYWLVTGRRGDFATLLGHSASFNVSVDDLSVRYSILALQGPASAAVLMRALDRFAFPEIPYFGFAHSILFDDHCWIARLGFSGELGYEIIVPVDAGRAVWENLCDAGRAQGLEESGFEAADSLRIESGYILFKNEISTSVTPFELGLARLVCFGHDAFIGAKALSELRWRPPDRLLIGIEMSEERRPESGTFRLSSSAWSPIFRRRLALGFALWPDRYPGTLVTTKSGEVGRVVRLPFYDPPRSLPRGPEIRRIPARQ
jgi:aminomethyltransferase